MNKYVLFLLLNILLIPNVWGKSLLTAQKYLPGTFQDLSFTERLEVLKEGYEPFADMSAYRELNVVPGEEHFTEREMAKAYLQQQQDKQTLTYQEYCERYPDDTEVCAEYVPTKKEDNRAKPEVFKSYYSKNNIGGGSVVENNFVTGQSCYPADKDRHFKNIIYTSGRYESISPAFEKGLISVFRKEGECGIIPNDPCGYTCYGIGSKCNNVDVTRITRADAEDIYYNDYWKKNKVYLLPDVIATDVFLAVMASGPKTAIGQFREFLGLPKAGDIDNSVIDAVNNYQGDIHNDWIDVRDSFLQRVANTRYKGTIVNGYRNAIELKRKNGCHVQPTNPLYRS